MREGWKCPVCGTVWAPFIPKCTNCPKPPSNPMRQQENDDA